MIGKEVEGNEAQRRAAAREETVAPLEPPAEAPIADFSGRNGSEYTEEHARVFTALTMAQAEHNGEAVYLDEIAEAAGVPEDETRAILHDLTTAQRLVAELKESDHPDLGPRYEVKPGL